MTTETTNPLASTIEALRLAAESWASHRNDPTTTRVVIYPETWRREPDRVARLREELAAQHPCYLLIPGAVGKLDEHDEDHAKQNGDAQRHRLGYIVRLAKWVEIYALHQIQILDGSPLANTPPEVLD